MRALDLHLALQVLNKLNRKALLSRKFPTRLTKNTADVVPRTLVLWRKPDGVLSELDLTIDDVAWDLRVVFDSAAVWSAVFWVGEDDEKAVGPRGVVADIVVNEGLEGGDLGWVVTLGWEEVELADNVLSVRPDVVVLRILREHLGQEVDLGLCETKHGRAAGGDGWVEFINQELAVVPDLVVLWVCDGDLVDPCELVPNRVFNGEDDGGTVEPDGVMRRVELNQVGSQIETTL